VDFASIEEVDAAVKAARAAFPAWRATSLSKRTDVMFRIRNLVEQHREEIAAHLTREHGKVRTDALGEVQRGLENLEFATGIPTLLKGGFSEQVSGGIDVYQIRQPLGVVAGITPFNFPAMVPMWMFANAIACGNTFILKPSEKDPSASIFIAELLQEAGLPDGVVNLVYGSGASIGTAALASPELSGIHFTGSTGVFNGMWETVGANVAAGKYHGYPRLVGETGGKDFILAHPSAGRSSTRARSALPPRASTSRRTSGPRSRSGSSPTSSRSGWATRPTSRTSWAR
jgi:malonate-semialdehyde dehydrogenase (acetylating)/methylmalonate-semialdehyde dehydrogenase